MPKEYDLCHDCRMQSSDVCAFLEGKGQLVYRLSKLRQEVAGKSKNKSENERTIGQQIEWNRLLADANGCPQALPTGSRSKIGLVPPLD